MNNNLFEDNEIQIPDIYLLVNKIQDAFYIKETAPRKAYDGSYAIGTKPIDTLDNDISQILIQILSKANEAGIIKINDLNKKLDAILLAYEASVSNKVVSG